ncbi:FAD-binding oxidoreductase [Nibrella saemangeumensis]|uniref:FAD-binding oxidoreductase n=1 Tax=Nibrella saemangeumensis TaxID=1084526 RepID=A0ABP8NKT1_9BACT
MDLKTASDVSALLDEGAIQLFKASLQGRLLRPGDEGYDKARIVWNGMIDRRPAMIARCLQTDDVLNAVAFARRYGLLVSVKGGGHNVAGNAVCEDGLMIDLSLMNNVTVDPDKQIAVAGAGALWSDLDQETQRYGLATTGGTVSHTGIAGLTLGGGLGWLMGKHGLTCDNLLSVQLVTADARVLTASKTENKDLFWAIRGGGGNFGIVTSFMFQLHPVGPEVVGGMILYPMEQAKEVLQFYRDVARRQPDALMLFAGLLTTPDGLPVIALLVGWFGPTGEAEDRLREVRAFGNPLADLVQAMPYSQLQGMFDAGMAHGIHRYWKSGYIRQIDDAFINTILTNVAKRTSPLAVVLFLHMKGAATRIEAGETAYGLRNDQWDFDIISQWTNPDEAPEQIAWVRNFWNEIEPFTQGVYVNHLDAEDGTSRIRAAYGPNYDRLTELKAKYDPDNFFRLNNNISPLMPANHPTN